MRRLCGCGITVYAYLRRADGRTACTLARLGVDVASGSNQAGTTGGPCCGCCSCCTSSFLQWICTAIILFSQPTRLPPPPDLLPLKQRCAWKFDTFFLVLLSLQ